MESQLENNANINDESAVMFNNDYTTDTPESIKNNSCNRGSLYISSICMILFLSPIIYGYNIAQTNLNIQVINIFVIFL